MKINFFSSAFLRRLLANKKFTVTLSVILSVVIWFVATVNRNPVRNQVFNNVPVSVSIEGTVVAEMGLGIVSDTSSQKFTVTVSGPNYIVSSLKPSDILLTAAVTDVNASGKYSLTVSGTNNSDKTGYSFVSIEPSTIDVVFDYIDTKEFDVIPKLIGVSATEGLVAENPVVSNSEESIITIKGPRSVINRINSVEASATVNKTLSSTQSYDAEISLLDENEKIIYRYGTDGTIFDSSGNSVNNNYLTLSSSSLKITQPISKKRSLKVRAVFANMPAGISTQELGYTIDHETVSVIGTPDVVDNMTEVTLSSIDFRTVTNTSNSFEVSPILPDGVKLIDNISYFTVKIDTSDFSVKTFTVSDIRFTDVSSGLTAEKSAAIKNVKICGPKKTIAALKASDLYAQVSLKDKTAGEYTVTAIIKSDKYSSIWQIGDYSTAVALK